MINFDDKRGFYRMMVNSMVNVTVVDDEVNQVVFATCRDLSATGMALELPTPMEMGTLVKVGVDASSNGVHAFDAKGKVVRITEEGSDCYLIGIEITEMD